MSAILKSSSEKRPFLKDTEMSTINDPIDLANISKTNLEKLTVSSAVKAGIVSFTMFTLYCLAKTTNILSHFGWKARDLNSKDANNGEITKIKNRANALTRRNLETTSQVNGLSGNQIEQTYRNEKTVTFEEIKVEEFENLHNVKKENREKRKSISIKNPIPNQYINVGLPFNLTIDGNFVFDSSSYISLDTVNIPNWLNVSNPNPVLKGSYKTADEAWGVEVSGNYAYLAYGIQGLQILDVTNPSNPIFKGGYHIPGFALDVSTSGNYAYLVGFGDTFKELEIIDITNSSKPIFKGSYNTPGDPIKIKLFENYAYVAEKDSGLQIIDISDPANPKLKGRWYETSNFVSDIDVSGNYAYLTNGDLGLYILNISNPAKPFLKGSYLTRDSAYVVVVSENYAYVGDGSGFRIIDVSDPSKPTLKGSCDLPGYYVPGFSSGIALYGNYAYVANGDDDLGGLQVIDINDLSNPILKGLYSTSGSNEVAVSGKYVYLTDFFGLQIIDPNLDKLKLWGATNFTGKYSVGVRACNEAKECVTDSFDIIVKDSSHITINLNTILILIGSISGSIICSTAHFCCLLIICGGTAVFIRNRNKKTLIDRTHEHTPILSVNSETKKSKKYEQFD
jgi:hypothetical protein